MHPYGSWRRRCVSVAIQTDTAIHILQLVVEDMVEFCSWNSKLLWAAQCRLMFNNFFVFENGSIYEVMWKHIIEPDRPLIIARYMSFPCRIPKAANTQSEYVTHFFSTTTMVTRTCLSVTLYVHCLYCWCLSVHRCICVEKKNQLCATELFIALTICSTCFGHFLPIIRSSRLCVLYYRLWCAMPWLLVVGGQVQGSRLCVRNEGCWSSSTP